MSGVYKGKSLQEICDSDDLRTAIVEDGDALSRLYLFCKTSFDMTDRADDDDAQEAVNVLTNINEFVQRKRNVETKAQALKESIAILLAFNNDWQTLVPLPANDQSQEQASDSSLDLWLQLLPADLAQELSKHAKDPLVPAFVQTLKERLPASRDEGTMQELAVNLAQEAINRIGFRDRRRGRRDALFSNQTSFFSESEAQAITNFLSPLVARDFKLPPLSAEAKLVKEELSEVVKQAVPTLAKDLFKKPSQHVQMRLAMRQLFPLLLLATSVPEFPDKGLPFVDPEHRRAFSELATHIMLEEFHRNNAESLAAAVAPNARDAVRRTFSATANDNVIDRNKLASETGLDIKTLFASSNRKKPNRNARYKQAPEEQASSSSWRSTSDQSDTDQPKQRRFNNKRSDGSNNNNNKKKSGDNPN